MSSAKPTTVKTAAAAAVDAGSAARLLVSFAKCDQAVSLLTARCYIFQKVASHLAALIDSSLSTVSTELVVDHDRTIVRVYRAMIERSLTSNFSSSIAAVKEMQQQLDEFMVTDVIRGWSFVDGHYLAKLIGAEQRYAKKLPRLPPPTDHTTMNGIAVCHTRVAAFEAQIRDGRGLARLMSFGYALTNYVLRVTPVDGDSAAASQVVARQAMAYTRNLAAFAPFNAQFKALRRLLPADSAPGLVCLNNAMLAVTDDVQRAALLADLGKLAALPMRVRVPAPWDYLFDNAHRPLFPIIYMPTTSTLALIGDA